MGSYRIQPDNIPDINIPAKEIKKIFKGIEDMKGYIPDPRKFETYIDYILKHPGEMITYEGYLAHKMRKTISQGKKEGNGI